MPQTKIECPSGLVVVTRGLRTSEADIIADASGPQRRKLVTSLLGSCTLNVESPGPYAATAITDGVLDWGKVHVGDRMLGFIRLRVATFGDLYEFPVRCSDPTCKKRFEWELRLSDLPVKPLSEAARAALASDRILTATFLKRVVKFKLLLGEDEERTAKLVEESRGQKVTASLLARVVAVDGVAPNDLRRWIRDLEMADTNELQRVLDELDGGVETDIQVECPECGAVLDISLPFGKEFLRPKRKTSNQ